jgi:cytochrome c oxidase subunit 2
MSVERYEKIWMWAAGGLIALFLGAIVASAVLQAVHPPGLLETVDPARLDAHPEFGSPTVTTRADGTVVVPVVAETFAFAPDPIEVPAHRPVTFRITSRDVMHGFQVVGTNANVMVIPGYVTQFTLTFTRPGEYAIACNEYCGLLHHAMVGKLVVKP